MRKNSWDLLERLLIAIFFGKYSFPALSMWEISSRESSSSLLETGEQGVEGHPGFRQESRELGVSSLSLHTGATCSCFPIPQGAKPSGSSQLLPNGQRAAEWWEQREVGLGWISSAMWILGIFQEAAAGLGGVIHAGVS